jgi:hypothetical protein
MVDLHTCNSFCHAVINTVLLQHAVESHQHSQVTLTCSGDANQLLMTTSANERLLDVWSYTGCRPIVCLPVTGCLLSVRRFRNVFQMQLIVLLHTLPP